MDEIEKILQNELQYGDAYLSEWERGRYRLAEEIAEKIGFVPKGVDW